MIVQYQLNNDTNEITRRSKLNLKSKINFLIECYEKLSFNSLVRIHLWQRKDGASDYSGVRKWRIKGRWENSCASCKDREDIKGHSRSGVAERN